MTKKRMAQVLQIHDRSLILVAQKLGLPVIRHGSLFGPQPWHPELRALWADPALNVTEIARRLGHITETIQVHAAFLGLDERPTHKSTAFRRARESNPSPIAALEERRAAYLVLVEKGCSRTEANNTTVGEWLRRNDRKWRTAHQPPRRHHKDRRPWVDWAARDREISARIPSVAQQLLAIPGKPKQVTKTLICRTIGPQILGYLYGHELPLTLEALGNAVESEIDFVVRYIRWLGTTQSLTTAQITHRFLGRPHLLASPEFLGAAEAYSRR